MEVHGFFNANVRLSLAETSVERILASRWWKFTGIILFKLIVRRDDVHEAFACSGNKIVLLKKEYQNCDYPTFLSVLKKFLEEAKLDRAPDCGCFAVAGPVADNKVRFTNRDSWSIDGDEVAEALGIARVVLINDFLAVGYGILTLDEEKECIVLQKAPKRGDAPIACIGAGTGLGECFLTPNQDGEYTCFPTEGGHAEFAPRSEVRWSFSSPHFAATDTRLGRLFCSAARG